MPAIDASHKIQWKLGQILSALDIRWPSDGGEWLLAPVEESNGYVIAAGRTGRFSDVICWQLRLILSIYAMSF